MKLPAFNKSLVVGVRYRSPFEQTVAASIAPCDGLVLEREPNNSFDSAAIKVLHGSTHIGYIQREVAALLSPLMDRGFFYTATVVKNCRISIVANIRPIDPPKKKATTKTKKPMEVIE